MSEADYYPPGAYKDPRTPYNEVEVPSREFDVIVTETLYKDSTVTTNDYYFEEPDPEEHPNVNLRRLPLEICTDQTNWSEPYFDQHFTPSELINEYKTLLESMLNANDQTYMQEAVIRRRISECEGWMVDDSVIEQA